MNEQQLAEKYILQRGCTKSKGFAINTEEMNPNDYDEIFFEGDSLEEAIEGHYRVIKEYWVYEPSEGEQIFEDVFDAVEYVEDGENISFEDFKKSERKFAKDNKTGKEKGQ